MLAAWLVASLVAGLLANGVQYSSGVDVANYPLNERSSWADGTNRQTIARQYKTYSYEYRNALSCGANQVLSECLQDCRPTCSDPMPICRQDCNSRGCQCKAGYVRSNDGACISVNLCHVKLVQQCKYNEDCSSNEYCGSNGLCRPSAALADRERFTGTGIGLCRRDSDCRNLYVCLNGRCIVDSMNRFTQTDSSRLPQLQVGDCLMNGDCEKGKVCVDKQCRYFG